MRLRLCAILFVVAVPLFAGRAPAVTVAVPSKVLGTTRSVLVSLPEGYERSKDRYPVLYMTDGEKHLGSAIASADALAGVDRMPPVIIVAIPHTDRIRDLTPTHVDRAMQEGVMRTYPNSGGGRALGRFVAGELIPAIESRFRTAPYRMFAGHSLGGLFGLDLFLESPDLFQAWLIVSPSTGWDGGAIFRRAEALAPRGAKTTVLLMHGEEGEEMASGVERVRASLRARGVEVSVLVFPDDDHITVPMPAYYAGLRRVFKPWFFRILDSDDPEVLSARIVKHYEELSARYGYRIAIPEHRLERIRSLRR
ncbi:MAG TPA: alpha/beta hydrolase-fold protein [Thermoanaerobaculia bacterium]